MVVGDGWRDYSSFCVLRALFNLLCVQCSVCVSCNVQSVKCVFLVCLRPNDSLCHVSWIVCVMFILGSVVCVSISWCHVYVAADLCYLLFFVFRAFFHLSCASSLLSISSPLLFSSDKFSAILILAFGGSNSLRSPETGGPHWQLGKCLFQRMLN